MKTSQRAIPVLVLGIVLVMTGLASPAFAGVDKSDGDCGPNTVKVRAKVTFKNTTGQTAKDLHFTYYQNDRPGVNVEGGEVHGGDPFDQAQMNRHDNGQTDGEDHAIDVDMSGGDVLDDEVVNVELVLCLNKKNILKIKDAYWTDGQGNNIGKAKKSKGWRVRRPAPGGDGGNQEPGGGGRGAQEGDGEGGGGAGPHVHRVIIENDDPEPFRVTRLKLLASMTYYDNIADDINWDDIDSIAVLKEDGIVIPPDSKWTYDFHTTGAYLGGHIYLMYGTTSTGVSPLYRAVAVMEEEELDFGEHPPDSICTENYCMVDKIPTLTEWGMIIMFVIMAAGVVWFVVRQRRRIIAA